MVRLFLFWLCILGCVSTQDLTAKAPPAKSRIALASTGDPTAGTVYNNGTVLSPMANYTLENNPNSWVYVEIISTDVGNNYYWGSADQAFVGSGVLYFGPCNALPPGNYECIVYSLDYAASDTTLFSVKP